MLVTHTWAFYSLLIPYFSFSPLPCYSALSGTYLWDICRKVDISMWKGSFRQCYALCIPCICMKSSCCHFLPACNLLAIFQTKQEEQSEEGTQATPTSAIPYDAYLKNSPCPRTRETSNARKCHICQDWLSNCLPERRCVNKEGGCFSSHPEATQAAGKHSIWSQRLVV